MSIPLRQSTASQEIPIGFLLDSTDGNTEETGLTIANTDIKLWKSGATTLANKNSGGATHISNGVYYAVLDATDTDTVGSLIVFCHPTGALAIRVECYVFEEVVYDAIYGASAGLRVSLISDAITASVLAADAVAEIQSGLATSAALTTIDDFLDTEIAAILADTNELQTDWANGGRLDLLLDGAASAGDPWTTALPGAYGAGSAGYILGTNVIDILTTIDGTTDTINATVNGTADDVTNLATEIGTAGAGLTALPWNASWDTEVQSEVQDAIEVNHLDHLLAVDYDPAAKPGTATALLNELIGNDAGVSQFTANALELAPSGGGGVADWTADERTALRAILGIPASGTTPEVPSAGALKVIDDFLDTEIAAIVGYIDTEVAAIKAKTDNLPASPAATGDAMTLAADAVSAAALSAAAVDEILDEVIEGSTTLRQAMRALLSLAAGKSSRSGSTIYLRDIGDTKNRVALTHDSNADRTAVTMDLT